MKARDRSPPRKAAGEGLGPRRKDDRRYPAQCGHSATVPVRQSTAPILGQRLEPHMGGGSGQLNRRRT
jgi:hypothetical protein